MSKATLRSHKSMILVMLTLAILSVGINATRAEDETESWQPPAPAPDKYDWVQLTSGEWLKGEIIAMYEKTLEFELTRLLDFDISLIWDRIQDPQEDADGLIPEQDDYRLVFFLGFEF